MVYLLNPLHSIYLQFLRPNLPAIPKSHHPSTLSYLNNDQAIQNACKLILIAKTYGFNSLSKAVFVCIEILHRPQKEAVGFVCSLIELPNLFEVQKALKKDTRFKVFAVEYVQNIVKDKMNTVVSNPKLSMSSSKISSDIMEGFFILTIDNEYARNTSILQYILRVLAGSIGVSSYSSY